MGRNSLLRGSFTPTLPRSIQYLLSILLLVFSLSMTGCDETASPDSMPVTPGGEPEISTVQTPDRWVINSRRYHPVRLQLDLPESLREDILLHVIAPPTVLAVIRPLDNENAAPVVIQLLDDGSRTPRLSEPDYMDSLSRDAVPGDFFYSASINSRFTAVEGEFEFRFLAGDLSGTSYEDDILYPSELPPVGFQVETSDTVNVGVIDLTPSVMNASVGRYWSFGSDYYRLLTVDIQLPPYVMEFIESGEIEPPQVTAKIWRDGEPEEQGAFFQLLDDGGSGQPVNPPPFQEPASGDATPGDLSFNTRIHTGFAVDTGTYLIRFAAGDLIGSPYQLPEPQPGSQPTGNYTILQDTLLVSTNHNPVIESVSISTELLSGFDPVSWTVTVSDEDFDAEDTIAAVEFRILEDDTELASGEFSTENGFDFFYEAAASLASGIPTGTYSIQVDAYDRSEAYAEPFLQTLYLENTAPLLLNLVAPDTVERPLEGENLYFFYLEVSDPQTLSDVASVRYEVQQPNSDEWIGSPDFVLFDNGDDPDETAADGIYSAGFITTVENNTFGTYIFRFIATDQVGNESEPLDKPVEFVESREG